MAKRVAVFLNFVDTISATLPAMSRSDGLVQRRNVSHSPAADGESAHGRGSDDEESWSKEEDSKETRFTLMEEVLLLGLKDEQVTTANS